MIAVIRPWLAALAAGALVVLAGCGGDDDAAPSKKTRLDAGTPGAVTAYVQDKLRAREKQRQAQPGVGYVGGGPSASPVAGGGSGTPTRSGTVLQEAGVDEADLLKTDGTMLYAVQPEGVTGGRLQVQRRAGDGRLEPQASFTLPADPEVRSVDLEGLMLDDSGRTLAVVSQAWRESPIADACPGCLPVGPMPPVWVQSEVVVQRVDVTDPAAASAGTRLSIQGNLVGSRRIGNRLYVVSSYTPALSIDLLPYDAPAQTREAAIAAVRAEEVLPRLRVDGGPALPMLAETDCWLQTGNGSYAIEFSTITVIDLASPTLARQSRCFAGGAEALYMSTAALYIASTRVAYWPTGGPAFYAPDMGTDLHKFALDGGSVAYRASGSVPGHLGWDPQKKPLRLSEHEGDLRVLSYTAQTGWATPADAEASTVPASPALLTVLRERTADGTLQPVATLPNDRRPAAIGKPGEQVYGVRFAGARAYVVTFRIVDPLYVLDLADPADPKIAGALEAPGFSTDLFPLGDGLLFGAGQNVDADGRANGLRFALFDVRDIAAPRELASVVLGERGSNKALDLNRHAIDIGVVGNVARIALPVNLANADASVWTDGLQRFEVDLAARTLATRSMTGPRSGPPSADWWLSRSVQIGEQVYFLQAGALAAHPWGP